MKTTITNIDVKSFRNLALFIGFPFIIVLVFGWQLMPHTKGYIKEVIAFGLFTAICFAIIMLIKQAIVKKIALFCFYIILAFFAFTKLSFYLNYGVKISPSAMFVILETNSEEASGFLNTYLNWRVIGLFFLFLIPLVFYKKLIKQKYLNNLKLNSRLLIVCCILLLIASGYVIHHKFSRENILLMSLSSIEDYKDTKALLKKNLAKPTTSVFKNVTASTDASTHVVIIGEATSRWHMQLYNYNRETNPRLTEIQDELLVFDSVITPHVHTILALEKMFTMSNYERPDLTTNGSIVQLANQANYETYWISNQKPVGLHESIPTLIGSAAKHKYFLATDDYSYDIYDETVLPVLETILKKQAKRKLIFIHLIGSHGIYEHRYPESFNYFKVASSTTKFQYIEALETINHYDNAIRYNDFIVREIIELVRSQNTVSAVNYFSDHGEEVYDTMELEGHNEYHATRPMYEIPFVVWLSDAYKERNPNLLNQNNLTKRRYNLEDFIHSFSTLYNIEFSNLDQTRSVFDSLYIKRPRLIKKGEDYDKR